MVVAIDVGNSRIKVAVYEQDTQLECFTFDIEQAHEYFQKIFKKYPNASQSILSNVGKVELSVVNYLQSQTKLKVINHATSFPFTNLYQTPNTLGIDRMVVTAGAVLHYPNQNRLIIDAGTCITYDFVDSTNNYYGGAISPGLAIRYKSLNKFTASLPLLETKEPQSTIGNCTEESIHSGIINGVCYEIEGFIAEYKRQYQHLTIILTGGDAVFLAKRLKSIIFANSNFLLESLNALSNYISKND